jgi:hypothetical protein
VGQGRADLVPHAAGPAAAAERDVRPVRPHLPDQRLPPLRRAERRGRRGPGVVGRGQGADPAGCVWLGG